VVPDERAALETEIARLQGENATLKKELLGRGLPIPGASGRSVAKPDEPEVKLPSDADVDSIAGHARLAANGMSCRPTSAPLATTPT
jgi:hypothetical protein